MPGSGRFIPPSGRVLGGRITLVAIGGVLMIDRSFGTGSGLAPAGLGVGAALIAVG